MNSAENQTHRGEDKFGRLRLVGPVGQLETELV